MLYKTADDERLLEKKEHVVNQMVNRTLALLDVPMGECKVCKNMTCDACLPTHLPCTVNGRTVGRPCCGETSVLSIEDDDTLRLKVVESPSAMSGAIQLGSWDLEYPGAIHAMEYAHPKRARPPMMDSGAVVNACMPGYGGVGTEGTTGKTLRSVTGGDIKHFGKSSVLSRARTARGAEATLRTEYEVTDVGRPAWGVPAANDAAKTAWFSRKGSRVAHEQDVTITVKGDYLPLSRVNRVFEPNAKPLRQEHVISGVEEVVADDAQPVPKKTVKVPDTASAEVRRKHEENCTPYRSWCPHGVSGQRNDDPHRRKDDDEQQSDDPTMPATVEFDYTFPSIDDEDVGGEGEGLAILVGFDKRTKGLLAVYAREKGAKDKYQVDPVNHFVQGNGHAKVVFKTDPESSASNVVETAAGNRQHPTLPRMSPRKSKGPLGGAENGNKTVE